MSGGFASCATPARTGRWSMPRSRWRWAARSPGAVDPKEVIKLVEKCLEAGVDFVAIADTVGYAGPKQVGELTRAA